MSFELMYQKSRVKVEKLTSEIRMMQREMRKLETCVKVLTNKNQDLKEMMKEKKNHIVWMTNQIRKMENHAARQLFDADIPQSSQDHDGQ